MQLENVSPSRPLAGRELSHVRQDKHPPHTELLSTSGHTFPKNIYVDAHVHMDTCCVLSTALEWRSESSLGELVLPSYHMGSGTELRLSGLAANKRLHPLSHLSSLPSVHEMTCLVLLTMVFQPSAKVKVKADPTSSFHSWEGQPGVREQCGQGLHRSSVIQEKRDKNRMFLSPNSSTSP